MRNPEGSSGFCSSRIMRHSCITSLYDTFWSNQCFKTTGCRHSLYKHSLYVTKFIRTFFIRDRVYTEQSLYRTNFIQGQSLYEDKVYTGTKNIRDKVHTVTKFIRGQSLYNFFPPVPGTRIKRLMIKC